MANVLNLIGAPDNNSATVMLNRGNVRDSLMRFEGNNALVKTINTQITVQNVVLGGKIPKEIKIQKPLLILNSICNPDSNAKTLKIAREIVKNMNIPTINQPELVMKTRKDQLYVLLGKLEGASIPKTIRMAPKRLLDIEIAIKEGIIDYPFVFQPADSQARSDICLIRSADQLHDLERFAFDGRDYYVSEFVDHRSAEGLYRRYRVLMIDGKPYPGNMMISQEWVADAGSMWKLMENDPALRDEEKAFLQQGDALLNALCEQIYTILPLDYFVVEFGFDTQKKPLILEVSSCVWTVGPQTESEAFDYRKQKSTEIKEALSNMIHKRLKSQAY
ncbi:MAG: hypothetical protein P794_05935 [Epsilonproteobacteria bacterium (ex Lamellibrachia satsuma)]|nr:MAG: hypothetical protein P794_05935 [Epsilonproteobacteria bacterium (ex Lamellibrachia satsuma)]